ncbi:MAG: response regulator [Euzebya sp.]
MRVLIVDDEPDLRMILQFNVRRSGHEVVLAADASQAYDHIVADPPDALLLDVSMPGETGLELLDRLRAEDRVPSQVALLSAALTSGLPPELADQGVRMLPKPFGVAELEDLVSAMAQES